MVETGRAGPSHNHYDYNQRLTSAAEARPLTSPLPYRFSVDLGHHIRSTGACAVPCHQEAALGSRRPRTWGRSVVQLGPYDNFAATQVTRQFKLKPLRERFSGWRIVWLCRSCRSAQSPTATASALPRAGAVVHGGEYGPRSSTLAAGRAYFHHHLAVIVLRPLTSEP
jgi:hypothetical protein